MLSTNDLHQRLTEPLAALGWQIDRIRETDAALWPQVVHATNAAGKELQRGVVQDGERSDDEVVQAFVTAFRRRST